MSQYNQEGFHDGDWDERGDVSWNEADWQQFLLRQEKEVARFLRTYDAAQVSNVERLDWVANQMGWDSEDWAVGEFDEDDPDAPMLAEPSSAEHTAPAHGEFAGPPEAEEDDPYTLHRHPVYVVSSGLFTQLRYIWRNVLHRNPQNVDPRLSWDFSEALFESERQSLLAMQSMDAGDLILCVVHMKRALRGINVAMALVPHLAVTAPIPEQFRRNVLARLFDLREVILRVISDCREEERGLQS